MRSLVDTNSCERWECTGNVPSRRCQHTASLAAGKLYVYGGYDGTKCRGELHLLDTGTHVPATQTTFGPSANQLEENRLWKLLKPCGQGPPPLAGHSAVVLDNRVFIFGGRSSSKKYHNMLYCLNTGTCTMYFKLRCAQGNFLCTDTMEWTTIHARNPPAARAFHASVAGGTSIYIFGGTSGTKVFNDLHRFDVGL